MENRKITKEMVRNGYDAGTIKLIDSDDGVVCQIGDYYFYFGSITATDTTADEYMRNVPKEDILQEIYDVLEDFREEKDTFGEEYLYYYFFLKENLG